MGNKRHRAQAKVWTDKASGSHASRRRKDLRIFEHERVHFSFGSNDKEVMLEKLGPMVRSYARNGIRKPRSVASAFNRSGIRTACGANWSPRLAALLLEMLFERKFAKEREVRAEGARPERRAGSFSFGCRLAPLTNPLVGTVPRNVRFRMQPAKKLAKVKPVKPAPSPANVARHSISHFQNMPIDRMATKWCHAVHRLAMTEDPTHRESLRQILDAIGSEWERRNLSAAPGDYFKWPSTEADEGSGSLSAKGWPPSGLLKFMGYVVGRTAGEPPRIRQAILTEIFTAPLPPVDSHSYMSQWGHPCMPERLHKMAETLAALTRNAKRRGVSMADAISDWEADLLFLKSKFYIGHFCFSWPITVL